MSLIKTQPNSWDEFVAELKAKFVKVEGDVETVGKRVLGSVLQAAENVAQNFEEQEIAFVETEAETFMEDLVSGKMSIEQSATAVFNKAQVDQRGLLKNASTPALKALIAGFAAGFKSPGA